jgi:nitrogen fixation/metabolism regulation signal transduction histidine kinase
MLILFLLRGWSVTLVAALFAFAAKDTNIDYVIITYISTPLFWLLDGYYLSQERKYRDLYNIIRQKEEDKIDFDMNATITNNKKNSWLSSTFSITQIIFYGTLIAITLVVMFIIN